jgi:predicted MPP superfamily phosphohydrolase
MPLRLLGLFAVIVPTLLLITSYVARRAAEAAGLGARGSRWSQASLWAAAVLPFAMRFVAPARDAGAFGIAQGTAMVGFGVGLACLIALGFLVPVDLLSWLGARLVARRGLVSGLSLTDGDASGPGSEPRAATAPEAAPAGAGAAPESEPPSGAEPASAATSPSASGTDLESARAASSAPSLPLGRREVIRRTGLVASLAIGGSASTYGIARGRHDYVLEEEPIPLARLPRSLDGYTIAQISDVHVGSFVGDWELAQAEALIRRARPDLIVMTGDLVDHDPRYIPRLGAFARRLVELGVRDGVVAIAGNHDYYAGVDAVLDTMREAGVRVLRNEGLVIADGSRASAAPRPGGFSLLGIDDVWAQRYGYRGGADLERTLSFARPGLAKVMLCHNPELFPEAAEHVDLMLSGHTHGGQVSFLVRPADWFLRHGYVMGHYHRGASQIYVNRGFGTAGPPARIATPPEISRIVLTT